MDKMDKRNDQNELNTQQQALISKLHAVTFDDAAWPSLCNDIALAFDADGNVLFANSLALLLFGHQTLGPAVRAGVARQFAISRETLRRLFDLTPGESQVGLALANGASLAEIASTCGVSLNTVKTHLRHIFGKTGTCRQGELIALLHSYPH